VRVRQAGRMLSGTGAARRFEWTAATTGTHHETRQFVVTFSAGRSGASDRAESARMAEYVLSYGAAARMQNRQGGDGTKARSSFVLDDAEGMGLRTVEKVRFARGKARTSRWCETEHRVIDWVSRSLHGEFEEVIMIERVIEEMHGSD